jgi:hypothetical protein
VVVERTALGDLLELRQEFERGNGVQMMQWYGVSHVELPKLLVKQFRRVKAVGSVSAHARSAAVSEHIVRQNARFKVRHRLNHINRGVNGKRYS